MIFILGILSTKWVCRGGVRGAGCGVRGGSYIHAVHTYTTHSQIRQFFLRGIGAGQSLVYYSILISSTDKAGYTWNPV